MLDGVQALTPLKPVVRGGIEHGQRGLRSRHNNTWHWPPFGTHTQYIYDTPAILFSYVQHNRHAINHTVAHPQTHTHHHCLREVSSWEPRGDRCVKTTHWFHSSLPWCCLVLWCKKKNNNNTGSDLLCILLMHFSRVTLQTPCSLTLKSNLALPGLKAHVKLKATLGHGHEKLSGSLY